MGRKLSKAAQAAADAAYLASEQALLPLDEVPASVPAVKRFADVPTHCPKCDRTQTVRAGWTLAFGDLLQCGGCGYTIEVPRSEYERYAKLVHDTFAGLSWVKPKKEKKERGAR